MMKDISQKRYVDKRVVSYKCKETLIEKIPRLVERAEQQVEVMRKEKSRAKITVVSVEDL